MEVVFTLNQHFLFFLEEIHGLDDLMLFKKSLAITALRKRKIQFVFLTQGREVFNEIVAANHLAPESLCALVQRGTSEWSVINHLTSSKSYNARCKCLSRQSGYLVCLICDRDTGEVLLPVKSALITLICMEMDIDWQK